MNLYRFTSSDLSLALDISAEIISRDDDGVNSIGGYDHLGNDFMFLETAPWSGVYEACWFAKYAGLEFSVERMEA